jgi:hypothetical protein
MTMTFGDVVDSRSTGGDFDVTPEAKMPGEERVRTLQDETARLWTVHEKQPASDTPDAASLLFVSDYSIRRVRDYPANWFELSDAELFEVSLNR